MPDSSAPRPTSVDRIRTHVGAIRRTIGALVATTTERQALEQITDAIADLSTAEDRLKRQLDSIELENLSVWLTLIESRLDTVRRMKLTKDLTSSSPDGVGVMAKPAE